MSDRVTYSSDFRTKFITEVKQRTELWDKTDSKAKCRDLTFYNNLWDEIAFARGIERNAAKKLWKSLVDQFRKIFRSVSKRGPSGKAIIHEKDIQKVKWPYFPQMIFLSSVITTKQRGSKTNVSTDDSNPIPESQDVVVETFDITYNLSEDHLDDQSNKDKQTNFVISEPFTANPDMLSSGANEVSLRAKRKRCSNEEPAARNRSAIGEVSSSSAGQKRSAFGDVVLELMENVPAHSKCKCMIKVIQCIDSFASTRASSANNI